MDLGWMCDKQGDTGDINDTCDKYFQWGTERILDLTHFCDCCVLYDLHGMYIWHIWSYGDIKYPLLLLWHICANYYIYEVYNNIRETYHICGKDAIRAISHICANYYIYEVYNIRETYHICGRDAIRAISIIQRTYLNIKRDCQPSEWLQACFRVITEWVQWVTTNPNPTDIGEAPVRHRQCNYQD